jgi:GntR family transcriptional regulator, rspAB operon transcriptional repressor
MCADNVTSQLIDVTNINEKVYQLIKQNIIKFIYPPGHNLNINELKDALGVSPTPIKDALFKLAGEGLVVIYPRKGTYVKDVTGEDIHEIIQTRLILETAVVADIANRISDEQLQILEGFYQKGLSIKVDQDNIDDYKAFMESDSQFHLSFFLFWGNKRVTEIYRNLNAHMQIARYRLMHHTRSKNPWTDQEHREILTALQERNTARAQEAVRRHLVRLEKACLEAAGSEAPTSPTP